jgi:L-methionine (R)-S-oxide reductase
LEKEIKISGVTKEERYISLLSQIESLILYETDLIAGLSNFSSAIHFGFNFFWTGFYLNKNSELVLGPFQGPVACSRIAYGKGVCGKCWEKKDVIIVDDVNRFPGHIACSSLSKSEMAIPVFDKTNEIVAVFDIDSDKLSFFDEIDKKYIVQAVSYLSHLF